MRKGATFSGWLAAIITALFFGIEVWVHKVPVPEANAQDAEQRFLLDIGLRTCEWLLSVLNVAWVVFLFFFLLMNIADVVATHLGCRFSRCKSQGRCGRAAWTAEISMILPVTLIVILTSAFWKILIELLPKVPGASLLDKVHISMVDVPGWFAPSGIAALQNSLETNPKNAPTIRQAIDMLINMQGNDLIIVCHPSFVGALAVWALLPVIIADVDPPDGNPEEAKSVWLGASLDAGYKTLRFAGEILRWTYLVCAAYVFAHLFHFIPAIEPVIAPVANLQAKLAPAGINEVGATLIAVLGTAIVLILTAGQGPLSFLALGFKAAIAVALDVIAWLRVRPEKQNPKGRICARFVSLLRHVCSEHTSGASYRGIVLVAHSQGTVITTDLLRFLHYQFNGPKYDTALKPLNGGLPVYLMTFGNPLRQLYDLRFPDLYSWTFQPRSAKEEGPTAEDLGVHTWINGYRSGDYVGRYLWRKDAIGAWIPNATLPEGPFNEHHEFCLGEGAHVHYFDATAPSVPLWLNRTILEIVSGRMLPKVE